MQKTWDATQGFRIKGAIVDPRYKTLRNWIPVAVVVAILCGVLAVVTGQERPSPRKATIASPSVTTIRSAGPVVTSTNPALPPFQASFVPCIVRYGIDHKLMFVPESTMFFLLASDETLQLWDKPTHEPGGTLVWEGDLKNLTVTHEDGSNRFNDADKKLRGLCHELHTLFPQREP